jgi:hypothetical protein
VADPPEQRRRTFVRGDDLAARPRRRRNPAPATLALRIGDRWTPQRRDAIESNEVLALSPHPSTPAYAWTVSALAERTADDDLRLRYVLRGPLDGIRLPPPGALRRADRLWEHTCAEAFLAAEGTSAYVELNFSPSREWAAYAFTAYREGAPLAASRLEPRIIVRRERDALALDVLVALTDLSCAYQDAVLRVGLSVVVEATDGRLSYWALRHPSAHPDFHHADGFALRLEPPRAADADGEPTT